MEVMIEPLLASKNLCNLADVVKYPPSSCQTLDVAAPKIFFWKIVTKDFD